MATTAARKAFFAHLIVYLAVNGGLLALNAMQTLEPGEARQWWALWPLAGWGIGLAAHGFAEWSETHAREGRLLADPDVRGVAIHLFVYMAVNAFLIFVNLTTSPKTLWFVWPLLGWGLGLAGHAWLAYRAVLRKTAERYATEQQILSEMQLERQAAEIAAAIAEPAKKKAPATRKRRKQAAARPKKKAAPRRGSTTARAGRAKKAAGTSRRKKPAKPKSGPRKPRTK